jgi:exoribonuclease II
MPTAEITDLRTIAHRVMQENGLEPDFPSDAQQQLAGIKGPASASDKSIRDMRQLLWCSIDNDTSKDLDQLTVAEQLPNSAIKIFVAIADVDAVVSPGTPINRHAQLNTTSIYTDAQIFPMLPERLSTDLTSLNENQDRLAVVIELSVLSDGTVEDFDVYQALVKNHAKLAYRSVAAWLDGKATIPQAISRVKGMDEQLRMQDRIAQVMKTVRYQHGALELESLEPEPVLRDGQIVDLRLEPKNRAQELIEDFMIAANSASATFLENRSLPSFRRIVRAPERWERIRKVAEATGDQLPPNPDSKALGLFLSRRRQADPLRFPDLSLTIVKLMGPGEYVVQLPGQTSEGHFGLAVPNYSHSTAPNRRFADLITQRLLKAALKKEKSPYSSVDLDSLATHCTEQEDKAKKVERQVRKSAAAQFLGSHIGESYDALITGISEKGTWVRLLKPPVEGKLMNGFQDVHVGDQIKVKLTHVNIQLGFIDFDRVP